MARRCAAVKLLVLMVHIVNFYVGRTTRHDRLSGPSASSARAAAGATSRRGARLHQFTPTALQARATAALSAELAPYRSFAAEIDARRAFG